ncbi:MAG: hypothetical protein IPM81_15150 [Saprospirales bacterium]|nr:hypothetical protein [Saprospirales bacterium]
MLNIVGQEFCTSQSMGTNCCGMQPSYRCLDIIFNLTNGPMGQQFGENCHGMINLLTENGNFDALYFNVGTPNPMGNASNCAAPIMIGNNHVISVEFTGNNMGQLVVKLTVINNMGVTIYSATQPASPGQSVILTICKPGFGCLEDEIIFGCCNATATIGLAPAAPSTICAGTSTTLKLTGMNGTPPYTLMVKAASASDTTYFPVVIPDDLDGNTAKDTLLFPVSPAVTTTYTVLSVEDAAGCVQPVMGQSVLVTVNPIPTVNTVPNQTLCNNTATAAIAFSGAVPGTVFNWTNNNTSIGLGASGTGDIPSFTALNAGATVQTAAITVTPAFTNNGVTCTGNPVIFTIVVNPTPSVNPVPNQERCSGDATAAVVFGGPVAGTVFNWTNNNTSIGLGASGTGNIPSFTALNVGNTTQVATITATPVFTNNSLTCAGTPAIFTISVFPRPTVFAGNDQTICQNQQANLAASLGGGATGGTWSGGSGSYANPFAPNTTYTPAPAEYGTTIQLTFTTNDPAGPCPAVSDKLLLTINKLPLVSAGKDIMICKDENLDLSLLGAFIQANGSGVSTGAWSTAGSGAFQPNNTFAGATTYLPSNADRLAGFVVLTLTSADPAGPCLPVSDQMILHFQPSSGLVCNDNVMIALDEDGMVEILPDMILEGTYVDSMFIVQVLVNGVNIGNKVDCSHLGKTLQVRVIDNCSGVYCTGSVVVKDNLPPKMVCTNIVMSCVIGNTSPDYLFNVLGLAAAYPVVDENCDVFTLTHSDTWHDLTCTDDYIGYVRRVWTATDPSGNKATCTQYINYVQQSIADVILPADITLNCSDGPVLTGPQVTGAPYITAFGIDFPIYPDAGFCRLSATYADNKLTSCDGTYDIIRTWTVYDWCTPTSPMPPYTNPKYHIQIIKVLDSAGPALTCPPDLTVSTNPLDCCSTTDLPDVVAEDVCSRIKSARARVEVRHPITGDILTTYDIDGAILNFPGNNLSDPDTLVSFGLTPCLPLGAHTVTYTVEDDCGNTSSCSFGLTVQDLSPPVAACDEITQVALGIDGMIFVNANTFDDGSYDNCSEVWFKARRLEQNTCQPTDHFFDQVKFCCEDINDTVLVILRVYDVYVPPGPVDLEFEEAHSNECLVQVYVEDKIKPSCLPPAHVTVSCENFDPSLWAYGAPGATDNCCVDTIIVNANYQQFDTVCNKGTITRSFRVYDCGGLSNQCTQRVVVEYEQDYYIRFPHDVVLSVCDGSGSYGAPVFFGEDCELLGVSHEDEVFTVVPDACFKIERTWTVINWCTFDPNKPCIYVPNPNPNALLNHPSNLVGPTVSPAGTLAPWAPTEVRINPGDPLPTNYSTFWSANANCYKYKQIIKIIDKQVPDIQCPASPVQVCDQTTNDPALWNAAHWYDPLSGQHDLCEAPADLCITASDACSGSNVQLRYLLFLDLDNNGTMETVISSTNPPDPGVVLFGNAGDPNYSGGTPYSFDSRPVGLAKKYRFALQTTVDGDTKIACVRWNTQEHPDDYTIPELPYGTHKIKWIAQDGCGNERVCEYTFVVKDCKAPTVSCYNGLSTNIMPQGMGMVEVSVFVKDAYDNCTPSNLLIFGIREANTGNGFPFNPDGTPQTTYVFDCDDLGFNLVEIWVMDMAGNADFCATYILVQDNIGACGAANASVAGSIQTESGQGVEDVNVQIQGSPASGQAPVNLFAGSDNAGHFLFSKALPYAANAVVTPVKDNDPLNGVSTFDLVLINKHILGLEPLNTPYKMIAADANSSRSITTFDIVELRKLILGVYTDLPDNSSWRFLDKAYSFPNPYNPFQDIFPETKGIADIQSDKMEEDFIAIKTGDVNGNVIANSLQWADDRTAGVLLFDIQDRMVAPNEVFTVSLKAEAAVLGYQFTLLFPGLQVLDIQPGAGMTADHFGVFPSEHALTTSFAVESGTTDPADFSVTFRAESAGLLSKMLGVSSRITRAEAYALPGPDAAEAGNVQDIQLRFNTGQTSTISGVGFELYQNQPNPWTNTTRVGFHLPQPATATLRVFDDTGRTLFQRTDFFSRGYNAIAIDNSVLANTGLLYYKLETGAGSATRKMIRLE